MIIELELGLVIALQAAALFAGRAKTVEPLASPAPTVSAASAPSFEIVKRVGYQWLHVGHRQAAHPDVHEALRTPGLALRHLDGHVEEGEQ